jgi:hypothetical protein
MKPYSNAILLGENMKKLIMFIVVIILLQLSGCSSFGNRAFGDDLTKVKQEVSSFLEDVNSIVISLLDENSKDNTPSSQEDRTNKETSSSHDEIDVDSNSKSVQVKDSNNDIAAQMNKSKIETGNYEEFYNVVYNAMKSFEDSIYIKVNGYDEKVYNLDVVNKILQANGDKDSLKQIVIKPNNQNRLRVVLEKDVPTSFMKLFNINDVKVTVASAADILPMSRGRGAVPLGIDDSVQLEYLKEYSLKVASGDSTTGNFGILALSGTGASLYEQDLLYGYKSELKVGDIIATQTGNVDGKTRSSINSRISSCPYAVDDYTHRDCPRIVLVSVYKPYNVQSNQVKQVKITGFAYFYIKSPMGSNDTSIDGYFIQKAGSGYGDATISDKGAYAIRLTE